jgi:hypothetical protein
MPYSVALAPEDAWLVLTLSGKVGQADLVAARREAAALNESGAIRDFVLDFSEVSEFVLDAQAVEQIGQIDRARAEALPTGRGALVAHRELVRLGMTLLAAVSPLNLDYRLFADRAPAEAWLRGELNDPPPPLPKRKGSSGSGG